jgi:hypothetical protein
MPVTGGGRLALRGSRAGGEGARLLAQGRPAGAGALGDDGGGRGWTRWPACQIALGAGNRSWTCKWRLTGPDFHERLCCARSGRDHRPSACAGRAAGPTRVRSAADIRAVVVSCGPIRAQAGAVARRAARKDRRGKLNDNRFKTAKQGQKHVVLLK